MFTCVHRSPGCSLIQACKARLYTCTPVSARLFPCLGQILKLCPKKKSSSTYTFCKSVGLLGMQFHLFENECKSRSPVDVAEGGGVQGRGRGRRSRGPLLTCSRSRPVGPGVWFPDYSHGITLVTPLSGSEKKQVLHFCALGLDEMRKFVEDLKESIAEVTELEQIRIECKDAVTPEPPCGRAPVSGSRVACRQTLPAPLRRVCGRARPLLPSRALPASAPRHHHG